MPNNAPKWLHTPTPYVPRGTPNIHRRTTWKSLSSLKWVKSYLTLHTIIHKLYNYKSCHTLTHLVPYMAPRKLWILLEASFRETGQQHLLARTCRTGYWRHAGLTLPIRLPIRNYLKKTCFAPARGPHMGPGYAPRVKSDFGLKIDLNRSKMTLWKKIKNGPGRLPQRRFPQSLKEIHQAVSEIQR